MKRCVVISIVLLFVMVFALGCADEDKVLTVGVTDDYPPMGYRNSDGELIGFEIDLAKAVADEMNKDIEFVVIHREDMMGTLKDRKVDVLISSVSMTKSRQVYMDFTDPYLANGHVIVTRPELEGQITSIENLAGMSAGVEVDSTVDLIATSYEGQIDFTLVRYETMSVCIAALKAEQLDCIVCDMAVAIDICAQYPDQFVISSAHLTNEPLAIGLNLDNDKLKRELNDALAELRKEGTLAKISKEHLGDDYTTDIDTKIS